MKLCQIQKWLAWPLVFWQSHFLMQREFLVLLHSPKHLIKVNFQQVF